MKKIVLLSFALLALCSCKAQLPKIEREEKKNREEVTSIDSGKFLDVTLNNVNASVVSKKDFNHTTYGTFYSEDGSSFISIDPSNNLCFIHTSNSSHPYFNGKRMDASFIYDLKAASNDVLYLCPLTMEGVLINIDGKPIKALNAPSFSLYIPLYGFGENRIEVSSVLEGETSLPYGTYWKK